MKTQKSFSMVLIAAVLLCFSGCDEDEKESEPKNHFTIKGTDYPLHGGIIENYGEFDMVYNLDLTLYSSGISYNSIDEVFSGVGDLVYFEMYCSSPHLTSGTFTFDNNYSGNAGTFDMGIIGIGVDIESASGTMFLISSGTVKIVNSGSVFEITINCKSTDNVTVSGFYKGTLINHDLTGGSGPVLNTPLANATLDNGCNPSSDVISWRFDWVDFPGATMYNLYVIGSSATIPVINETLTYSEYLHNVNGYIGDQNCYGWIWKVRAFVDGNWGDWSEKRTFDVEPPNTDCP